MTNSICKAPNCRRTVAGAARLCDPCAGALADDLSLLPVLYEECGRLLGGSEQRASVGRTSGGPLPGLPFNDAAADARAAIRAVLGSWSALVADERGIARPRRTAAGLSCFLTRHLGWLCGHESAAEFAREIGRLTGGARRVARPDGRRRVPVGAACVESGCAGELVALVRPHESPGEIVCSADAEHRWAAHEWLGLSRRLDRHPGPADSAKSAEAPEPTPSPAPAAWLTATEVARLWRLPTGSVYRLASEHRWNRRTRAGRTYYDGADVERTFAQRATTRTGEAKAGKATKAG
ncbi:helix-turn-helix domain-containing protein [Actinomadura nitritigenes]|uniref:helix-turn-helix domain-containing protein n=1 Tax=Actinomadura nitritigenes TaxID=134602 RepID=UPI00367BE0BE